MSQVKILSENNGVERACHVLGVPRATYYRQQKKLHVNDPDFEKRPRKSPLALSEQERQEVLSLARSERFIDASLGTMFATLLDENRYICSERTMYRILEQADELRERRKQRRTNQHYKKPELLATAPNELWSWDITKLKGPRKWTYYYLYAIIDVYSRYIVGWLVADREASHLAEQLIAQTCDKQKIDRDQLTLHADRGSSMRSKPVAHLLSDLGVTKTHSRPYTSNDNPFSESQFKTMKYCPQFPGQFGCIQDAKAFCRQFFRWYNDEHRHSGINRLTPRSVHYGYAEKVLESRNRVLAAAFEKHPNRFKFRKPHAGELPNEVWINPPVEVHENADKVA